MVKKIREEDLEQTRSGLFARKSLAIMTNEFSYFFSPVLTRQNDYECFGNMDDSRPQFGCQSFIML